MASFSSNRTIKINDIIYRQLSQTEWLNTKTGQRISSSALSMLITNSRVKATTTPTKKVLAKNESFYPRLVKIGSDLYKQISPTQWENTTTGQIFNNINNLVYLNILKTKASSPTPSGGLVGACCEVVNGVMQCNERREEACAGGCFKGAGTNCFVTDENPIACSPSCVHCCFVGSGCFARTPSACLAAGGTYFAFGQGCTACKFGVCSSDSTVTERFYGNGCTGTFVVGGGPASFEQGVFCTGSGVGQTCFGPGQRYQNLTPVFIEGGTCTDCIFGACCTGGTCAGITSQSACTNINGIFFAGQTCIRCDFGVYCTGAGNDRTCIRTGYRGEALSSEFIVGATCSRCIMGTCCVNGDRQVGVRQSECEGTFFANIFNQNACDTGSCCVGATCTENVFRYDCAGVFNQGQTCIACGNGACCLPSGGCTLTTLGACMATGGTFFGGQTCSACDGGVCCNNGECTNQRRGNVCAGNFYNNITCGQSPCVLGACCVGNECNSSIEFIACTNLGGTHYSGFDCSACATGANCTTDSLENGDRVCYSNIRFGDVTDGTFYEGQGCSACQSGACCNTLGGGVVGIRGDCTGTSTFYAGQTLYICDAGVFCTGSQTGQTCFGLGHRGQSLTNNFIAGATCNACILGACCTGGTCLSGGLTSQAACSSAGGLFFAGRTCNVCDYGVYCTGATCLSLGYRGQSLTNNFIVGATCSSCILGACCTGGTCSGGGQTSQAACNGLFIAGATCVSCDYGVFCTGATCAQIGYRGQNISNNFIVGATCSSCILGACCTGGTCLGGGQTSQAACQVVSGIFYAGLTCSQCSTGVCCTGGTCSSGGIVYRGECVGAPENFIQGGTCSDCSTGICCTGGTCAGGGITTSSACISISGIFHPGQSSCLYCVDNVNCCVNGTHYYTSRFACQATGGIVFEGSEDSLVCESGAFCTGRTCIGVTLFGFDLGPTFIMDGDCGDCIYGTCCGEDDVASDTTQNDCFGTFTPGNYNPSICDPQLTFGICCNGSTCSSDVLQQNCSGYFISDQVAQANSISCGTSPCETGICCGENQVTSITGGVCLGVMRRAECALTGGYFYPNKDLEGTDTGYTCNNCLYTPMLASALFEAIWFLNQGGNRAPSYVSTEQQTGYFKNEIQPIKDNPVQSSVQTWVTRADQFPGYTTSSLTRANPSNNNELMVISQTSHLVGGFTGWFNSLSFTGPANRQYLESEISGQTFDYSPVFGTGLTNYAGGTLGYIVPMGSTVNQLGIFRYLRLVLGYGNPSDNWNDTVLVYRFGITGINNSVFYSIRDANLHAGLNNPNKRNEYPTESPFLEATGGLDTNFSSPILVQVFGENPLRHRIRPVGSCCVGATCIGIVTQDHCTFRGGTFYENGRCSRCYPNLVFGNCCVGGTHAGYTSLAACNVLSGTFFEGSTYNAATCIYGTICQGDQCYQGISASYYGAFSSTNNKFFIEQEFGNTLGCLSCDAGLCCVGATCMGKISRIQCGALGGTLYPDETTCQTNCDLGICCEIGGTCGTYTNRANCYGTNQVFVSGATAGATCSACSSLLTLTSSGSGVTYTMILNKGTTHGTFHDGSYWVQETPDLKLLKIKMNYSNLENTNFEYNANTKISGLTLNDSGYKGSVYVHGCVKNPVPLSYIDKNEGVKAPVWTSPLYYSGATTGKSTLQRFNSICLDDHPEGWDGPTDLNATDLPINYEGFDLQGFLDMMNMLKYNGITLAGSDVVMASTSNFDIGKGTTFYNRASGYAYQVITNRANTLAYGILNCLSAANSALAGSTLCFRPPNVWPKEEQKPIYTLASLNSKVPGTPGNTLIRLSTSKADKALEYNSETAKTCAQASEFGDGVDFGIPTPMWAMVGGRKETNSYGGQYIIHLQKLLRAIHATGENVGTLTFEQRKDGLARIVQYGIDSWGAQRSFCLNLFTGAAQKAGRTRSWIPLAGYYLGVSAMYDPESTMLSDTDRMNHFISYYYNSDPAITPGGTCATMADWRKFRYGDTGSANNQQGIRRALARAMSHEAHTMVEYINDPSNLVRHYEYPGNLYKDAIISGFGTAGHTGITFYNSLRSITFDFKGSAVKEVFSIYGNFGTLQWGISPSNGTTLSNPFPTRFKTQMGLGDSIEGMWLRVESGPGSSGPSGATKSRFYRILYATGFENEGGNVTQPEPQSFGGGYQIIIGQTWADGVPDHTSVLKFYPLSVEDVGITRPSTFHPLGYTFGPVGYLIENTPYSCADINLVSPSTLFDAQTSSTTPYFGTSLYPWADQYLLADYIRKTKGISLISDVVPMADYLRQYIYTSPYNIKSLLSWYKRSETDSVFNTWLGVTWTDLNFAKNQINFAKHYPGVIQWFGLTV